MVLFFFLRVQIIVGNERKVLVMEQKEQIKALIKYLDELWANDNNWAYEDHGILYAYDDEIWDFGSEQGYDALFDGRGLMPPYETMIELRRNGYSIDAGERDSFGWLKGVISKGDKVLLFHA